MKNSRDDSCAGMWVELKVSVNCFNTSIYTLDSYSPDLKDIFTAAAKYSNQLPLLYSIDWYDHTFVQNVYGLKHELVYLMKKESSLNNQISKLLGYLETSLEKTQGKHSAFLFNGM